MTRLYNILKWGKSSKSVFGIIGFLLGRCVFFSAFNPFVLAYVTAFFNRREFYVAAVMSALGLISVSGEINVFRYIFAIVMLSLFNFTNNKATMTNAKIGLLAGLSTFTGGMLYTLFSNMALYYGIMSVLETVLTLTIYFIIKDNIGALNFFDTNVVQAESYSYHVSRVIGQKLKKAADIFSRIYKTYDSSLVLEVMDKKEAAVNIIENINENICKDCSMYNMCRNKTKTYGKLYSLLGKWIEEGFVKAEKSFSQECGRAGEIYMLSKGCLEMYRFNKLWLSKLEQSKLLTIRQLKIMSDLLSELHNEAQSGFSIDKELSNRLYKELTGLSVNSVVASAGKRGYEISVDIPHYYGCNSCGENIIAHINEILGVNMIKESSICRNENNRCILNLAEEPEFKIAAYSASIKKQNSEITGDCYTYMQLDDGRYLLALADGMGSGEAAREESAASIEMYEDFMEAGFDREAALDIINSVLLASNDRDCFSTLDICTIDLYSGKAEFVKIGAVSTFIVREDKTETVKSSTLPAGILGDIDTEVVSKQLYEGDVVIMVTDGVLDSTGNVLRNEKWILQLINKNRNKNPKDLAEIILKKAKENSHNVIRDDMTVLVAEIY